MLTFGSMFGAIASGKLADLMGRKPVSSSFTLPISKIVVLVLRIFIPRLYHSSAANLHLYAFVQTMLLMDICFIIGWSAIIFAEVFFLSKFPLYPRIYIFFERVSNYSWSTEGTKILYLYQKMEW